MSTSVATTKWLKYFAQAGIPSKAAANYAVIFTENRIQPDMLLDLNKEYLYDMGIRVMGDVIAILRYARTAYTEEAQKKILCEEVKDPREDQLQKPTITRPIVVAVKRTPSRITKPSEEFSRVKLPSPVVSSKGKKIISLKRNADEFDSDESNDVTTIPTKAKRVLGNDDSSTKVQRLMPKLSSDSHALKSTKRSVFRRLGESSVSSSTDSIVASSIFERLGPTKTISQPATSTVNEVSLQSNPTQKSSLYQGVQKTITVKKPVRENAVSLTTGAALRMKPSIQSVKMTKTIRNRLGVKPTSSSMVSTTSDITYKPQRLLIQRSLADVETQRRNHVIKLNANASKATGVKSRLLTSNASLLQTKITRTSLSNTGLFSKSRIATSERIVKKPTKILTKSSIFSRLGPLS